jgi:hypothetical protein
VQACLSAAVSDAELIAVVRAAAIHEHIASLTVRGARELPQNIDVHPRLDLREALGRLVGADRFAFRDADSRRAVLRSK